MQDQDSEVGRLRGKVSFLEDKEHRKRNANDINFTRTLLEGQEVLYCVRRWRIACHKKRRMQFKGHNFLDVTIQYKYLDICFLESSNAFWQNVFRFFPFFERNVIHQYFALHSFHLLHLHLINPDATNLSCLDFKRDDFIPASHCFSAWSHEEKVGRQGIEVRNFASCHPLSCPCFSGADEGGWRMERGCPTLSW